jgi:hypothetical protein
MTACCGIDCTDCPIFMAAQDHDKARALAASWRENGYGDAVPEWFRCQGCRGPDELVWSEDCVLRSCCKGKALECCDACVEFPCCKIRAFESEGGHHGDAVAKLREMHDKRSGG